MRARFILGVVGEDTRAPEPVDVVDYLDFDVRLPNGKPILRIKWCPFCGCRVDWTKPLRIIDGGAA